jgi:DNA polymerase III delta prime subunit
MLKKVLRFWIMTQFRIKSLLFYDKKIQYSTLIIERTLLQHLARSPNICLAQYMEIWGHKVLLLHDNTTIWILFIKTVIFYINRSKTWSPTNKT